MEIEMNSNNELIKDEIKNYTMLQRIKAANKEPNPVLDYEIRQSEVILHSFGVNTDDLRFE